MNNKGGNENCDINEKTSGDKIQQQGSFGTGDNKGTVNATNVAGTININNPSPKEAFKPIKYIPKVGSKHFVGRQDELASVHQKFDEQKQQNGHFCCIRNGRYRLKQS